MAVSLKVQWWKLQLGFNYLKQMNNAKIYRPPPYKKDRQIIHFILMGICFVVIIAGVLVYINR